MSRIVKSWESSVDENNVVTIGTPPKPKEKKQDPTDLNNPEQPQRKKEPTINIEALRREAEEIINNANQKAETDASIILSKAEKEAQALKESILNDANNQATSIEKQAHEEGYMAGIESSKEEAAGIVAEAEQIKADAHVYKDQLIANLEPELINIMIEILDDIIEIEKDINPQVISILIKQGIATLTGAEQIAVHVSPDDYTNIDKDLVLSSMETMADVTFVEDPTLQKGGCIINTPLGSVDCGLDTQYSGVKRNLQYILRNR